MIQTKTFVALTGKSFTGSALLEGTTSPVSLTITEIGSTGFYNYVLPDIAGNYIIKILEAGVWVGGGDEYVTPEIKGKFVSGDGSAFVTDLTEATNDTYNGMNLRWYSGPNKGLSEIIGNYVGSTKQIELVVGFVHTPEAGNEFEIIGNVA